MAPPSSRQAGFSRRAQLNLFTSYIIAGIGALIGAILLILSFFQPTLLGTVRGAARDTTTPAQEVTAEVRAGSQSLIETIGGYYRAGSQNARLKREMELARIRLREAEAIKGENARLKGLMGLMESDVTPVATTRMIGASASSSRRFGYIGAGRVDGVKVGMPVRSARGVVGRVLETGATNARILLLTDRESVLPVRRVKGDVVAFARGRGDGLLEVRLINLGLNPLEVGDMFVTSGAGGIFHPNIAVAIVEKTTDDGALARLTSDPAATDFVVVQPIFEPGAFQAVSGGAEASLNDAETDLNDAEASLEGVEGEQNDVDAN